MATTTMVKIQRGRYSPRFQVARALLTAASALVSTDVEEAIAYIDGSVRELARIRKALIESQKAGA